MATPVITLSVVVPMYNEAARIGRTVALLQDSPVWRPDVEFVFVDDGSTDDTLEQTLAALGETPVAMARVVRVDRNRGKGAAVRLGMLQATGQVIGFVDADLSLNPAEIDRAYDLLLSAQADAVIGERIVASNRKSRIRRMESLVFRRIVEAVMPTGVRDPQCALKLFRRDVGRPIFDCMRTDGFAFDVELLALLRRGHLRVREIPVLWEHQPGSRVDPVRDAIKMLREIIAVRRSMAGRPQPVVASLPENAPALGDVAA